MLDLINGLGKSTVGYQEIFDNGLTFPKSTVVDVWKNPFSNGQVEIAKVTAAGYPALMASGWYINYEAYVTGGQWTTYYNQVCAACMRTIFDLRARPHVTYCN